MKETCCICGKTIEGYGYNASPLADGRCCGDCHLLVHRKRIDEAFMEDVVEEH
ncbi:MAG: hypothetical protein MJ221_04885 [Bacilli bacterium]|nr:hypothetical protein [Bacilli bacterium]